jgi:hypothetical protein
MGVEGGWQRIAPRLMGKSKDGHHPSSPAIAPERIDTLRTLQPDHAVRCVA